MIPILTIFLLVSFTQIDCSILDYPVNLDSGNWIIHGSLTDQSTGQVWTMEERIVVKNKIKGRIDIISPSQSKPINVFYLYRPDYITKRLVMNDNDCDEYTYTVSKWSHLLPGVTKPLTNLILLMGPSFFYRLNKLDWVEGSDEIVRGDLMTKVNAPIEDKLNVTIYYMTNLNVKVGINQPFRIVLSGYNPDGQIDPGTPMETLILDIYLQSQTYLNLEPFVVPTPGIGCPGYIQEKKVLLPRLDTRRIKFIVKETQNGTQTYLKEIHADEELQTARSSVTRLGFTSEFIYDYNLGVQYRLSKRDSCLIYPVSYPDSPGIDRTGYFSLDDLLSFYPGVWTYLGEVNFEHRSGLKAHAWELTQKQFKVEGITYNKYVTTHYMSLSPDKDVFGNYVLVATTMNGYQKGPKGNMVLKSSLRRDYYDFHTDLPDSAYQTAFQLVDCYPDPDYRLTITLHIECDKVKNVNCIKMAEGSVDYFKEMLLDLLTDNFKLSPLRIVDIELIFNEDLIQADVTFIEAPNFEEVLRTNYMYLDIGSLSKVHEKTLTDPHECVEYQATFDPVRAVVHCKKSKLCASVINVKSIVGLGETNGTYCTVYYVPFNNLRRLSHESKLKDIHANLVDLVLDAEFSLQSHKGLYFIRDIVESDKRKEKASRSLFNKVKVDVKLTPNGRDVLQVSQVGQFDECYRSCSRSEDIKCETFTFCSREEVKDPTSTQKSPVTECYVSSLNGQNISTNLVHDVSCDTYHKSPLQDYKSIEGSSYKVSTSIAVELSVNDCASKCSSSADCFSFQYCAGMCTFAGYYSKSETKRTPGCYIYTPKTLEKYQLTGSKIVSQVLHTEIDVDMDTCATFCNDYGIGDGQDCKSFNYCPKTRSAAATCSLTGHFVSDSSIETIKSTNCHNYQLIEPKSRQASSANGGQQVMRSGISTGKAFGVIFLFLVTGLIAGFAGPYAFIKIKSLSHSDSSNDDFQWSRQVNAAYDENHAEEEI